MKLLGRLHQRTPRDRKANNGLHEEEEDHRHPSAHLGKHNSNSSSMAFSKYGDDTTLGGNDNNTLYEWSVADNAPSLGSAGELFAAKHNHKYKKTSKRRFLRSGYGSSSDEEDDFENDDDGDDNEIIDTVNYQYSKLSDSPPPKRSSSPGTATATDSNILNESEITLRTGNKKNSNDHTSTKRAYTKDQKDSKFLWNKKQTIVNTSENIPVDVDQFIGLVTPHHVANHNDEKKFGYGKENVGPQKHLHHGESKSNTTISNLKAVSSSSQPSKVTRCIKPQIDCGIDNIQDSKFNALYDSSVVSSGDGASTRTSLSMKNLVGSTSPYKSKLNSRQNYTHASFSKLDQKMIQKNVDPNFRINSLSRDIGGTDWLLNDKASSRKRHQLEHERLQNEIQNDKYQMPKVKAKAKNSIKTKMKKKIISLVGTKQKGSELKGSQSERGILPKAKLSRKFSEFSMEPLTGIEGFVKQDAKTRKEILTEIEHRRNIERQEVQKSEYEVKRTISRNFSKFSVEPLTGIEDGFVIQDPDARKETLLEMKHRQNVERQEAYKSQVARRARSHQEEKRRRQENLPRHEVPTQQLNQNRIKKGIQGAKDDNFERHRKKEKLQQWVSEFSQLSVDGGIGGKKESTSYLSSSYYAIKSNKSASRIDKNDCQKSGFASTVGNKGAFAFETNFPDEDSSAQSPFAAAPPKNENSFTCVVCKKGERTHLASPCMHFSFCGDCVNKLQQNGDMRRCVICDSKVSTFSKVFF